VSAGDTVTQAQIDNGDLTFTPDADFDGSTSFTYSAYDGEAYSDTPGTFAINITAANDAPTADAGSVTMAEDSSTAIALSGTDPDTGDSIERYRVDSLPDDGTLSLNGQVVSAGDTVTQAQIDNGDLTFAPDADYNGSTSFTYSAHDGEAYSDTPGTFTINVTPEHGGSTASAPPPPHPSDNLTDDGNLYTDLPSGDESTNDVTVPPDAPDADVVDNGQPHDPVGTPPPDAPPVPPATGEAPDHLGSIVDDNADSPATDTPTNDAEPVTWDGHEDLTVLDATDELGSAVEIQTAIDDATSFGQGPAESDPGLSTTPDEFVTDRVVELDAHRVELNEDIFDLEAASSSQRIEDVFDATPAVEIAGSSTDTPFDDGFIYQPVVEHHVATASSGDPHGSPLRYADDRADQDAAYDRLGSEESDHGQSDDAEAPFESGTDSGFFARLWAVVRGLGPIKDRTEDELAEAGHDGHRG